MTDNVHQLPGRQKPPENPKKALIFCDKCKMTVDVSERPDWAVYWANGIMHICSCTQKVG